MLAAFALAMAIVATLEAAPAAARRSDCQVRDRGSGQVYRRLRAAVRAAGPGARLVVKGTCHGGTFINKDLVIRGVRTRSRGRPILDGDSRDRVLTIKPGVRVRIANLTIRDGRAKRRPLGDGISNRGILTLGRVSLRRNSAVGAYNAGTLRLNKGTVISHNAIGVDNDGTLILNGSSRISRNREHPKTNDAGVRNRGTLILNGSSRIDRNRGGVLNTKGSVILNDHSSIRDNREPAKVCSEGGVVCTANSGGGIANQGGSVTMNDASSIHANRSGVGGGVAMWTFESSAPALTITGGGSITGNTATYQGGGLDVYGTAALSGVSCAPHTFANVRNNAPDDCHLVAP